MNLKGSSIHRAALFIGALSVVFGSVVLVESSAQAASLLTVDQFVAKYKGKAWDFDGVAGVQCVDLFKYYERDVVGGAGGSVGGSAYMLYTNPSAARLAIFDKISASKAPRKGDVAVWSSKVGDGDGHVAIVIADKGSKLSVIQQNVKIDGVRVKKATVGTFSKTYLLGYLRPQRFANFNSTKPSVSGTAKVGSKLTAKTGSWSVSGLKYTVQWLANGAVIKGATGSTFTPSAALVNKRIAVKVTASKSKYNTATATSAQTAATALGSISKKAAPIVSGTPKVGSTLSTSNGSWSPTPSSYAYQWLANGVPIGGASGPTYVPDASRMGTQLAVVVTARLTGYKDAPTTSAAVTVSAGDLVSSTGPVLTGDPVVGGTLNVSVGTWTPTPDGISSQWLADGVEIPGATETSFSPSGAQLGAVLSVRQTASKTGFTSSAVATGGTAPVRPN